MHGVDGEVRILREDLAELCGIDAAAFIVRAKTFRGDVERDRGGGTGDHEGYPWCARDCGCDCDGPFSDVARDGYFCCTWPFVFVCIYCRRDCCRQLRDE